VAEDVQECEEVGGVKSPASRERLAAPFAKGGSERSEQVTAPFNKGGSERSEQGI